MAHLKISKTTLDALAPSPKDVIWWDASLKGLAEIPASASAILIF